MDMGFGIWAPGYIIIRFPSSLCLCATGFLCCLPSKPAILVPVLFLPCFSRHLPPSPWIRSIIDTHMILRLCNMHPKFQGTPSPCSHPASSSSASPAPLPSSPLCTCRSWSCRQLSFVLGMCMSVPGMPPGVQSFVLILPPVCT